MGAEPGEAYLSVVLPPALGDEDVVAIHRGAEALAAESGVTIAGGDLARGPALTLAVTVVGWAPSADALVGRDGARVGRPRRRDRDAGRRGRGAGDPRRRARARRSWSRRYLRPRPQLAAGRALAARGRARCSTCLTDWLRTHGGSPRRAACASNWTRRHCLSPRGWRRWRLRWGSRRRSSARPEERTTSCAPASPVGRRGGAHLDRRGGGGASGGRVEERPARRRGLAGVRARLVAPAAHLSPSVRSSRLRIAAATAWLSTLYVPHSMLAWSCCTLVTAPSLGGSDGDGRAKRRPPSRAGPVTRARVTYRMSCTVI